MKLKKSLGVRLLGVLLVALILCVPTFASADSITPDTYSDTLAVGESVTITKIVTVSERAAASSKVDVFFLADTTGSMGGAISGIISSASTILSSTAALGDVAFGVGEYKDWDDPYAYRLNQDITTSQPLAQAGINMWSASGGNDWPEAQLYALEEVANTTSWRVGSERIIVWFGDAPGHDASGGSTEVSATAALVANGIQVEAINVGGASGLDSSGSASGEGGPAVAGAATRITAATGGNLHIGPNNAAIVDVIQDAITAAIDEYSVVGLDISEVPGGVTVTYSPAPYVGAYDRSIERTFEFDVTFTGDTLGIYDFSIYGIVDGGRVGTEVDRIVVTDAVIPEPSTYLLLGSGIAAFAFYRVRKKKRS